MKLRQDTSGVLSNTTVNASELNTTSGIPVYASLNATSLNATSPNATSLNATSPIENSEASNTTVPLRNTQALNTTRPEDLNVTRPEGLNATRPEGLNETRSEGLNATRPEGLNITRPEGLNTTRPEGLNAPNTPISSNSNTNRSELNRTGSFGVAGFSNSTIINNAKDLNHGDVISLESALVSNAYIQAMSDNCTGVVQGDQECGSLIGSMGMNNRTQWLVKQGPADSFCLQLYNSPNLFLFINGTDCTQGNEACGTINLFKADTGNCGIEYGVRFVPIIPANNTMTNSTMQGMSGNTTMPGMGSNATMPMDGASGQNFAWAIQSTQNANAFFSFDANECKQGAAQRCGMLNLAMVGSVREILPTSVRAFIIHEIEEEPVIG
jgi:hypothetical protein